MEPISSTLKTILTYFTKFNPTNFYFPNPKNLFIPNHNIYYNIHSKQKNLNKYKRHNKSNNPNRFLRHNHNLKQPQWRGYSH